MKNFTLPALVLLAGCGGLEPLIAAPVLDNPECRAEVRAEPEVRRADRASNFENQTQTRRVLTTQREAETRVYQDCLRRRGLPVPGGVEPIRRI